MGKKKKQFVWHKRRSKFISSHAIKSPAHQIESPIPSSPKENAAEVQKQSFSQKISMLIKKAVREEHETRGR
jgi:hypothetical protein